MIDEKERRKAAERFHKASCEYHAVYPEATVYDVATKFERTLCALLGLDEHELEADGLPVHEIFGRIADLIDRPTCRREAGAYEAVCSECGIECIGPEDNYCPNCGAEVIDNAD